ncbi:MULTISPECIES: 3-hydroxyacyl-CoA dehydrogenase family protein [Hungatella]|uniref:3-hydroxybutyryl-CoA epimerase n=1 Tax=Hungatella hathewayi TaxID=154046 RepID=A0AAW9WDS2_9FIRM|nr:MULTISPECIES: 3-hydroxyacyl-CoA dehydrogenase family protein [Hungatella]MCQ4829269.1 3-hydroxyacyl-CoA dehydrogenase family protein [Hungatella sp. SL.1.14]MUB63364.1 3-hydroxybutyryl-CoA epimerase [Hungatella hathewayi]CUQ15000.1 3-hydroxybutyryl-CoA dehydrogenase Hbd [Hungatella hathewayi]
MSKVVVIGAGMMGSGIGAMSALAGNLTVLVDTTAERAQAGKVKAFLCINERVSNQLSGEEAGKTASELLKTSSDLEESLQGADLVIEAIYENLEAKQELFQKIDSVLPANVPILSNTSGMRITDIAAKAEYYPERTMTAHFWLPAHLVPLVEVVMWDKTDEVMAEGVKDTLKAWGKAPVLVRKDLPGQLANRILQVIIREAVNIVDMGLASPEDVDTAVKMGMGIRFPAWGPLEHIDAIGLDLALSVQNTVLPGLKNNTKNYVLQKMVEEGKNGNKGENHVGFYDWTKRSMKEQMEKRNQFIIHALQEIFPCD